MAEKSNVWMESYLSNRKQFVTVNGSNSTTETIRYGVLQSSILGPSLFILYISDIPKIAPFAKGGLEKVIVCNM